MESRVIQGENFGGKQGGVPRSGLADGQCGHGNALGHLHHGEQRVEAVERRGGNGHGKHRQQGFGGDDARQMGRAARAGDEDLDATGGSFFNIFE